MAPGRLSVLTCKALTDTLTLISTHYSGIGLWMRPWRVRFSRYLREKDVKKRGFVTIDEFINIMQDGTLVARRSARRVSAAVGLTVFFGGWT